MFFFLMAYSKILRQYLQYDCMGGKDLSAMRPEAVNEIWISIIWNLLQTMQSAAIFRRPQQAPPMYSHTSTYAYTNICIYIYIYAHSSMHIHIYIHTCTHLFVYIYNISNDFKLYLPIYINLHVYIYIHVHTNVRM